MSETLEERLLIDKWTPREEAVWRKLGREAAAELSRLRAEVEAKDVALHSWETITAPAMKARALAAEQALAQAREARNAAQLLFRTPLSSVEFKLVDKHCDWVAFGHAWNAVIKHRLDTLPSEPVNDSKTPGVEVCPKCDGEMVCRCGQTASTHSWPCTHGGCLFECPKCDAAEPVNASKDGGAK